MRPTRTTRFSDTSRTPFLTLAAAFVTAALLPASGYAQPAVDPTARAPWDATVLVGLLSGRPESTDARQYADDWFNAAQGGVILGRHFTPHLKTEIEFSASTEGRRFVQQLISVPGLPYPVPLGSDALSRLGEIATSLTYQFLENQWAHPFVQIGAAADFDRTRVRTWEQSYFTGDRPPLNQILVAQQETTDPKTTVRARVILGAGAKWYVNRRVFVRTDARLGAGQGGQHLSFRIGAGWDF